MTTSDDSTSERLSDPYNQDIFWQDESPQFRNPWHQSMVAIQANVRPAQEALGQVGKTMDEAFTVISSRFIRQDQVYIICAPDSRYEGAGVWNTNFGAVSTDALDALKYSLGTLGTDDASQAGSGLGGGRARQPAPCPRHGEVTSGGFCRKCSRGGR